MRQTARDLRQRRAHFGLFLRQAMHQPGKVGAIAPSSPALARTMTDGLSSDTGPVIELGGGTGQITEAILARGVAPDRLTVIETDRAFCDLLRRRFPTVTVLRLDARQIGELPLTGASAVISGLPMLRIPPPAQQQILAGAFSLLQPGAAFVQFTYGWQASVAREVREALGLSWTVSPWIWVNVPPARVYRFRKAA